MITPSGSDSSTAVEVFDLAALPPQRPRAAYRGAAARLFGVQVERPTERADLVGRQHPGARRELALRQRLGDLTHAVDPFEEEVGHHEQR